MLRWNDARTSLFEGHADAKQGDAYEGYSLTVLALHLATSAQAAEMPSQSFLKKAIQGNYAEVEMGKLTQQYGQSDNVKNFGQMLQADHTAANEKAIDAAKSMGAAPPDGPNAKQKADYDKMSKMSGPQFDRDFATHMVADHQKDIAEYKKASKKRRCGWGVREREYPGPTEAP